MIKLDAVLKVKVADLDLSYRHDIYLREYILKNREQIVYEQYMRNIEAVRAPKRKRTFDAFMNLAASVEARGQVDPIAVEAVLYEDGYRLAPRDGAHRLAIMRHLGIDEVLVRVIEIVDGRHKSPGYVVDGERAYAFNNISEEAKQFAAKEAHKQCMHCREFPEHPE